MKDAQSAGEGGLAIGVGVGWSSSSRSAWNAVGGRVWVEVTLLFLLSHSNSFNTTWRETCHCVRAFHHTYSTVYTARVLNCTVLYSTLYVHYSLHAHSV